MRARKYTIISLIFWSIFIAYGLYNFRKGGSSSRAIQHNELTSVIGTLESQPTIKKSKGGSRVPIKLNEYPNFKFDAEVNCMPLTGDFISEVMRRDSIQIYILKYDYETKITKEKGLGFFDRIINYKFITPYAIFSKDKFYMKLEDTNREIEHNRFLGFWFFSVGAFFYLIYSILFWTGSIRRFSVWWNRMQASR